MTETWPGHVAGRSEEATTQMPHFHRPLRIRSTAAPWEGPAPAHTSTPPHPPSPRTSPEDRKSTRLNSSHVSISYAVFCLKKKIRGKQLRRILRPALLHHLHHLA